MTTSATGIWFTADLHLYHRLAATMRRFESVEAMNEALIENWNERVGRTHRVYLLGDVSMGTAALTKNLLDRLNGQIYLIRGNHETVADSTTCRGRFVWIKDVHMLKVACEDEKFSWRGKVRIWLSHYAHRSWMNSHHGSLHLYGHSHGFLPDDPRSLSIDVGIDAVAMMAPVSFEWVLRTMKTRKKWVRPEDRRDETPAWVKE